MVAPIIWAGVGLAVLISGGYTADKVGDALAEMNEGTKLLLVGGGMYISYRALQASGALK